MNLDDFSFFDETAVAVIDKNQSSITDIIVSNFQEVKVINRNGRLSPTTGAGYCNRQSYLYGTRVLNSDWDAPSQLYANIGISAEKFVADNLGDNLIASNIRIYDSEDIRLGGEIDMIVWLNGRINLLENKTCSELPKEPKPYQKSQLGVYMSYYQSHGILYYVSRSVMDNKRNLKCAQFDIPYSHEQTLNIVTNIFFSRLCIDNNLYPMKLISKRSDCGFCDFQNLCWNHVMLENLNAEMDMTEYLETLLLAQVKANEFMLPENLDIRRRELYDKICNSNVNFDMTYENFNLKF